MMAHSSSIATTHPKLPCCRGFRDVVACPLPTSLLHGRCGRRVRVFASDVDAAPIAAREDSFNDRVKYISSKSQLDYELEVAGDRLVVLELMADTECETGLFEAEPEDHWTPQTEQHRRKMDVCAGIQHAYIEMAADSPDSRFLAVMEEEDSPTGIGASLGISVFPAVVFFKHGCLVWQSHGSDGMYSDVAEGLLYFGAAKLDREDSVDCVSDLGDEAEVERFIHTKTNAKLKMLMITAHMCSPCVHIYPSYLTLAMNFQDLVDFGRVDVEADELTSLCEKLGILEAPTFITYYNGSEVDRLVSGNRGDLVGHLLSVATKYGISPPRPK
eukprot:jgi/Ulvmu1/4420/UM002_0145.1